MTTVEASTSLRILDEIAAAGADAVQDWHLTDQQCEQLAACVAEARGSDKPLLVDARQWVARRQGKAA